VFSRRVGKRVWKDSSRRFSTDSRNSGNERSWWERPPLSGHPLADGIAVGVEQWVDEPQ
jgi:hypothetical protein